jgi:hypothetical protein
VATHQVNSQASQHQYYRERHDDDRGVPRDTPVPCRRRRFWIQGGEPGACVIATAPFACHHLSIADNRSTIQSVLSR